MFGFKLFAFKNFVCYNANEGWKNIKKLRYYWIFDRVIVDIRTKHSFFKKALLISECKK